MATTAQRIVTILVYADIPAAHAFLVDTFGFESGGVHRNDQGEVMHGEVSLAGARPVDPARRRNPVGRSVTGR